METPADPLNTVATSADGRPLQGTQVTEILILPEGKVLVHNLTPVMAAMLEQLNPDAKEIHDRVAVVRDRRGQV